MSEKILQALMQLFAIGASLERLTLQSREIVGVFLRQQVSLQRIKSTFYFLTSTPINIQVQELTQLKLAKKLLLVPFAHYEFATKSIKN